MPWKWPGTKWETRQLYQKAANMLGQRWRTIDTCMYLSRAGSDRVVLAAGAGDPPNNCLQNTWAINLSLSKQSYSLNLKQEGGKVRERKIFLFPNFQIGCQICSTADITQKLFYPQTSQMSVLVQSHALWPWAFCPWQYTTSLRIWVCLPLPFFSLMFSYSKMPELLLAAAEYCSIYKWPQQNSALI